MDAEDESGGKVIRVSVAMETKGIITKQTNCMCKSWTLHLTILL